MFSPVAVLLVGAQYTQPNNNIKPVIKIFMANRLKISVENNEVLTGSRLNAIDFLNVLYSNTGVWDAVTYTATQDCWLVGNMGNCNNVEQTVNDVPFITHMGDAYSSVVIPLKKGDVLKTRNVAHVIYKIFGAKH